MQKPELLLLGTFHMAVNPHVVNQQKENILKVVESVNAYNPTKITVEKSFLIEDELDRNYQAYRRGDLVPAYDEVEQLAFRMADALDHSALFPVDEVVDMTNPSLNQVFEWAKEHQPNLFQEIIQIQGSLKQMENDETLIDTLHYVNNPAYIKGLQRIYMKLAQVGERQHQIGVQWLKQWHQRDLSIAANIIRIANPDDRILVLVGGDHIHLLQQFLQASGEFEMKRISTYLPDC